MIGGREYSGGAIDGGYQHISEAPAYQNLDQEAETVEYATDPEPVGEERSENVPIPESERDDRPDVDGQSTLESDVGDDLRERADDVEGGDVA